MRNNTQRRDKSVNKKQNSKYNTIYDYIYTTLFETYPKQHTFLIY